MTRVAPLLRLVQRPADARVVFVGGTLALKPGAILYYLTAALLCGRAELIFLPRGGVFSISDTVRWFEHQLKRRGLEEYPLVLIGHSQGGLIVSDYASRHVDNVLRVIAIDAPFRGSDLSWMLSFFPAFNEMRPRSAYLEGLNRRLPLILDRLVCVSSTHDLLVKETSSFVTGARNVVVSYLDEYQELAAHYPDEVIGHVDGHAGHLRVIVKPQLLRMITEVVNERDESAPVVAHAA